MTETANRFEASVRYATTIPEPNDLYRSSIVLDDPNHGVILDTKRGTLEEVEKYLTDTYKWSGYRDYDDRAIRFHHRVRGTFNVVKNRRIVDPKSVTVIDDMIDAMDRLCDDDLPNVKMMLEESFTQAAPWWAWLEEIRPGFHRLTVRLLDASAAPLFDFRAGSVERLEAILKDVYHWSGERDAEGRCINFQGSVMVRAVPHTFADAVCRRVIAVDNWIPTQ